jgi:hypothetical protein
MDREPALVGASYLTPSTAGLTVKVSWPLGLLFVVRCDSGPICPLCGRGGVPGKGEQGNGSLGGERELF